MKKGLKLFILTFVVVLIIMIIAIPVSISIKQKLSLNQPFANPSQMKMLIIEKEQSEDIYHIIFNKENICEVAFVELKEYKEEFKETSKTAETGFLYKGEKDGVLYVEYTGLRGFSYDEIKEQFKNDKILKEW